jgi:hypothetical protein
MPNPASRALGLLRTEHPFWAHTPIVEGIGLAIGKLDGVATAFDVVLKELALCASFSIDGVCALRREMDVNKVRIPPFVGIGTGHRSRPRLG